MLPWTPWFLPKAFVSNLTGSAFQALRSATLGKVIRQTFRISPVYSAHQKELLRRSSTRPQGSLWRRPWSDPIHMLPDNTTGDDNDGTLIPAAYDILPRPWCRRRHILGSLNLLPPLPISSSFARMLRPCRAAVIVPAVPNAGYRPEVTVAKVGTAATCLEMVGLMAATITSPGRHALSIQPKVGRDRSLALSCSELSASPRFVFFPIISGHAWLVCWWAVSLSCLQGTCAMPMTMYFL